MGYVVGGVMGSLKEKNFEKRLRKTFEALLIGGFLLLLGLESMAGAVSSPVLVLRPDDLDYVILGVNQERRFVRSGETMAIYRGDILSIQSVQLRNRSKRVKRLILAPKNPDSIGFLGARGSLEDFRGKFYDTSEFQVKANPSHEIELILKVQTSSGEVGSILIRVLSPVLNFVELAVNQQKKIMRDGDIIKVKEDDLFKVHQVVTNLPKTDQVFYQIVRENDKIYLQFARKKFLFATVTLDMEP